MELLRRKSPGYVCTETGIETERAHRVKRNSRVSNTNKPGTIVVKLVRFKNKTNIFQNANKLKGQNILKNSDFIKTTLDLRKDLMVEVKRLRELGKIAYLNYTAIVNVKINIKNKFTCVNKNAVQIKFRMFIIQSVSLARKLYEQRM